MICRFVFVVVVAVVDEHVDDNGGDDDDVLEFVKQILFSIFFIIFKIIVFIKTYFNKKYIPWIFQQVTETSERGTPRWCCCNRRYAVRHEVFSTVDQGWVSLECQINPIEET